MGFVCSLCGEYHDELMLDLRLTLPDVVFELDEEQRRARAALWDDFCAFEGRHFVRGLLELPIPELGDQFGYGVWVEVGEDDWHRLADLWRDERGADSPPFPGRLANELVPYRGTRGLPVMLQLGAVSRLPSVTVVETSHPLRGDQEHGIAAARAHELARTAS